MKRALRHPALTAAVAAALAGAGVATAAIPDGGGVIHGCYDGSSGALSVLDSGKSCPAGANALDWNQTGPQGPAGPEGPQGPAGPSGDSVRAEPPQIFERVFDGRLPGGRFSTLPEDGSPFDVTLDLPAGTYIVLAQMNMHGLTQQTYRGLYGRPVPTWSGVSVSCDLRAGDQRNDAETYFEYWNTWTEDLTVTLDAPRRVRVSCETPKVEPRQEGDGSFASVRSIRLTATRLPQTHVTHTLQPPRSLTELHGTFERRPRPAESVEHIQAAQEASRLSAIGRALRGR